MKYTKIYILAVIAQLLQYLSFSCAEDVTANQDWSINSKEDYFKFELPPVISFDDQNFNEKIKAYPFIMVEFYSPLCVHCKHLMPTVHAAAQELNQLETPIPFGAVNLLKYTSMWESQHVFATPALYWYQNGQPTMYTGGRTKYEIVNFAKYRSENPFVFKPDPNKPMEVVHQPTFPADTLSEIKMYKTTIKDPKSESLSVKEKVSEQDATIALNKIIFQNTELSISNGLWVQNGVKFGGRDAPPNPRTITEFKKGMSPAIITLLMFGSVIIIGSISFFYLKKRNENSYSEVKSNY